MKTLRGRPVAYGSSWEDARVRCCEGLGSTRGTICCEPSCRMLAAAGRCARPQFKPSLAGIAGVSDVTLLNRMRKPRIRLR